MITNHKARNIYGQIAVTPHQRGEREREEDKRQEQHRVERRIALDVNAVDGKDRQATDTITQGTTHQHLHNESHHTLGNADATLRRGYNA